MNQSAIISELVRMNPESRIIHYTVDGNRTPRALFDRGMWVCCTCGTLGEISNTHCKGCGEEKFILCDDINHFVKPQGLVKNRKRTLRLRVSSIKFNKLLLGNDKQVWVKANPYWKGKIGIYDEVKVVENYLPASQVIRLKFESMGVTNNKKYIFIEMGSVIAHS